MATKPVRNPKRVARAILNALEVWPDLRVGQLIDNVVSSRTKGGLSYVFYIEDEELAKLLEEATKEGRL